MILDERSPLANFKNVHCNLHKLWLCCCVAALQKPPIWNVWCDASWKT